MRGSREARVSGCLAGLLGCVTSSELISPRSFLSPRLKLGLS